MVVQIPPELEVSLLQAAQKYGVAPEEFVVRKVRQALEQVPTTLFDALENAIGSVDADPNVANFADGLLEKQLVQRL